MKLLLYIFTIILLLSKAFMKTPLSLNILPFLSVQNSGLVIRNL